MNSTGRTSEDGLLLRQEIQGRARPALRLPALRHQMEKYPQHLKEFLPVNVGAKDATKPKFCRIDAVNFNELAKKAWHTKPGGTVFCNVPTAKYLETHQGSTQQAPLRDHLGLDRNAVPINGDKLDLRFKNWFVPRSDQTVLGLNEPGSSFHAGPLFAEAMLKRGELIAWVLAHRAAHSGRRKLTEAQVREFLDEYSSTTLWGEKMRALPLRFLAVEHWPEVPMSSGEISGILRGTLYPVAGYDYATIAALRPSKAELNRRRMKKPEEI